MSNLRHRASSPVVIRSFQRSDQSQCVKVFIEVCEEMCSELHLAVLKTASWYSVFVTTTATFAAMLWSTWMLAVGAVVVWSLFVYPFLKLYHYSYTYVTFRNFVLNGDFKNIEKSYMCRDDCHMWVADLNGKVVGMVGLIRTDRHEPRVASLQRMYVVPSWRGMGIGKKLLNELIAYAKRQGIEKIVLNTSSLQKPALRLCKKHGFIEETVIQILGRITLPSLYVKL